MGYQDSARSSDHSSSGHGSLKGNLGAFRKSERLYVWLIAAGLFSIIFTLKGIL